MINILFISCSRRSERPRPVGSGRDRGRLCGEHGDRQPNRHGGGGGTDLVPFVGRGRFFKRGLGAILLLGSSMGGELFNEGAVEIVTLANLTNLSPKAVVARVVPLNLIACSVALGVAWALLGRSVKIHVNDDQKQASAQFRVNPFKALVPFLPLALVREPLVFLARRLENRSRAFWRRC